MSPVAEKIIIVIISVLIGGFVGFFVQKYFRKEQYRFEMFLERKRVYKDLLRILSEISWIANRRIKKADLIKYGDELKNTIYSNIPFISPKLFGLLGQYLIKFTLLKQADTIEALLKQRGAYETDMESLLSRLNSDIVGRIIKELSTQILLDTKEFEEIISQKDGLYNEMLKSQGDKTSKT